MRRAFAPRRDASAQPHRPAALEPEPRERSMPVPLDNDHSKIRKQLTASRVVNPRKWRWWLEWMSLVTPDPHGSCRDSSLGRSQLASEGGCLLRERVEQGDIQSTNQKLRVYRSATDGSACGGVDGGGMRRKARGGRLACLHDDAAAVLKGGTQA